MSYKITVLIPCYNSERFLETTINTVMNQSIGFENIELILIDDFSTDTTGQIIEEYLDKYENIKSYSLKEKAGAPGTARNIGIAKAEGEYIMFMDHDDKYPENSVEILYNLVANSNPNTVAIGRYKNFGEADWTSDMWMENNPQDPIAIDSLRENTNFITINNIWRMIFPVKFLRENNIQFPEKMFAEDLAFMIKSFLKAEKIIFTKEIVYLFRTQITDNSSTSYSKSMHYIGKLLDGYYYTRKILLNNDACEYYDLLFSMHLSSWIANVIESSTISEKEKYELLERSEKLFKNLNNVILNINPAFEIYRPLIEELKEGNTKEAYKLLRDIEIKMKTPQEESGCNSNNPKNRCLLSRIINKIKK